MSRRKHHHRSHWSENARMIVGIAVTIGLIAGVIVLFSVVIPPSDLTSASTVGRP